MAKRRKRKKKRPMSAKERRKKMLRGSEWVLLGILFVGISEFIVKHYGLNWRYMPYACAVWLVLLCRALFFCIKVVTKASNYLLNSLSDLDYKR